MLEYIVKRILIMIPTVILISIICFIVMDLPPGDYLTTYISKLESQGFEVSKEEVIRLTRLYDLDKPIYIRYCKWMKRILVNGDFGTSFAYKRPVSTLIKERLPWSIAISLGSLAFVWIVAFPIGIYSAVKQNSIGDYTFTFLGFIGLSVPNFLLALIIMYIAHTTWGQSVGGLFSPQYLDASWSWAKFVDLLKHVWIPIIVVGTAGTAGMIRTLRNNLLDELKKPYVTTARAKGLSEKKLLVKYPLRVAINPLMSTVGWILPGLISDEAITSIVLSMPTTGPLLLEALKNQDMYLAGSFLFILAILTVIGTLISDIILAWIDPRIRYNY